MTRGLVIALFSGMRPVILSRHVTTLTRPPRQACHTVDGIETLPACVIFGTQARRIVSNRYLSSFVIHEIEEG
jgi:hypothetical protein